MRDLPRDPKGILFDMDGTLAVGSPDGRGFRLLPGVAELAGKLSAEGPPFVVLTNGTAQAPDAYAQNLAAAGLHLAPGQMLTPSSIAAEFFAAAGLARILVLGVAGVSQPLVAQGLQVLRPGEAGAHTAEAVYIGWYPGFTLVDLEVAAQVVGQGAEMYVNSSVPYFFTSKGRTYGTTRMIAAAITSVTGRRARTLGKPSAIAVAVVARRLGCRPEEMLIIGDDPRLEAAMARSSGAMCIGVTTGLADSAEWAAQPPRRQPDRVIETLRALL